MSEQEPSITVRDIFEEMTDEQVRRLREFFPDFGHLASIILLERQRRRGNLTKE